MILSLYYYNIQWFHVILPHNSLGANFSEWWTLGFSRIFSDLEIHEPYYWIISHKWHFVQTVICHTLAMSTIIIVLYLCMVTTCTCICTGVSKNSRFSAVYVHKESSLIWPDPFLAQGIYSLQYKHPAHPCHSPWSYMPRSYQYDVLNYPAGPQLHGVCVTYSHLLLSPWTLECIATYCSYAPLDL